ncbi:MAG: C25 family cysteine peptidase [Promethearchaeota archaeon]
MRNELIVGVLAILIAFPLCIHDNFFASELLSDLPEFHHHRKAPVNGNNEGLQLLVLVEDSLYNDIIRELCCWVIEVGYQGFTVEIVTISAASEPSEIRQLLQQYYAEGMVGCLLVGNLSAPLFKMPSDGSYEIFPIDLYFMDLDGVFYDLDVDGILDWHEGAKEPDIFLGRLYPSSLTGFGDSVSLLKKYFARNSLYRRGQLRLPQRVLTFVDDDWTGLAATWHFQSTQVYSDGKLVNDPSETTASAYLDELDEGYEFVLVGAHSNPLRHAFRVAGHWTYVESQDIFDKKPDVLFANLFACSPADYRYTNHLAGAYLFADSGPLALIASSKTGSMYDFLEFYSELAQGNGLGISLTSWLQTAVYPSAEWPDSPHWVYGLTCFGDPVLPVALNHSDPDNDNLPTYWENMFGLNPAIPDGTEDTDDDGLTNFEEFTLFTNPVNFDTEGDGMSDGWEHQYGLDVFSDDSQEDPDNDQLVNFDEFLWGTNPHSEDSDGDGLPDYTEIMLGTNPANPDTDSDGLPDSHDFMPTVHWLLIVIPLASITSGALIVITVRRRRKSQSVHEMNN